MRQSETRPRTLQSTLVEGLDRYSVACAAVAAVAAVAGHTERAEAAIVYSGPENINVGYGSPGQLYINLVTKQVLTGHNGASLPGWDVNPFISSPNEFIYTPAAGELVRSASQPSTSGDIAKLTGGTTINGASPLVTATTGAFLNNNTAGDWVGAGTGYVGFKISHAGVNGGNPVFGWLQLSKTSTGTPTADPTGVTVVDWAYEDSGAAIAAGATGVPEPSCLALLAAGAMGVMVRRNRARASA